jgi:hypothetical protein
MGIGALVTAVIGLIMRIWDWLNGYPKKKLLDKRLALEVESRQHQLNGDLDGLRRVRAELQEVDRKLATGDY